jgi:hypothetical protein
MFRALPLLLAVFVIACSQVPIEGVTPEGASQARVADRESEGNLAAIKVLLRRERQQCPAVLTPINRASGSPLQSGPADDAGSSSFFPTSIAKEITSSPLLDRLFLVPHSRVEAHQPWPQVQHFAPPTRSIADYQTHNWPTVPPDTFYAPTGSAYPVTVMRA